MLGTQGGLAQKGGLLLGLAGLPGEEPVALPPRPLGLQPRGQF